MLIMVALRHSYRRKMHSGGLLQNFHKSLLAYVSVLLSVYRWMIDTLMMYLSELQKGEQEWTCRWTLISLPFTVRVTPGLQSAAFKKLSLCMFSLNRHLTAAQSLLGSAISPLKSSWKDIYNQLTDSPEQSQEVVLIKGMLESRASYCRTLAVAAGCALLFAGSTLL